MPTIHPTSIVEKGAKLSENVSIGPFCHVGPDVVLGSGTELVSHVVICGRTALGSGNVVWPHTVLGADPQDLKFRGEDSLLTIGDNNQIREGVTIHKGTDNDEGVTSVGSNNLIMGTVHIGHDCRVGNNCVIANAVGFAGHVHVEDYASVGGMTAVHHFITIGKYAYVGGASRLTSDVPPYMLVEGNPARVRKVNSVLLNRLNFPDDQIECLKVAYKKLFRGLGNGQFVGRTGETLVELEARYPDCQVIADLITGVRNSLHGVHGRYREGLRKDHVFSNPVK